MGKVDVVEFLPQVVEWMRDGLVPLSGVLNGDSRCEIFEAGQNVDVIGTSKGKGFQGTIKLHNHARGPTSHGSENVRRPGAIGMHTFPGRVLKGKAASFPEGTQVYFWTRVVGGSDGDRIHHVWIHGGKEVLIGLSIGGEHWRTYSNKMLHPGSAGEWAVEARNGDGEVLARQEFGCTVGPAAPPPPTS